jgi:hypothetical protein
MCRLEDDPLYQAKPLTNSGGSLTNEDIDAIVYDLKRWVAAPQSSVPGAPVVQGVLLAPNEDVQWQWTHTANGSYVSGYTIVPRLTPPAVILSAAKNLSRTGRTTRRRRRRGVNR